jgi:hypothetical protein
MSETEKELFEEANVKIDIKEKEPEPTRDAEEPTRDAEEPAPTSVEKPVKPVKKKREISEKQRAQLVENLKRGRETSLANRVKKKKLNAIAKDERLVEEDTKIFEALKKKLKPKQLEDENTRLKQELAELKAAKASAKKERASTPPPSSSVDKTPEVKPMPTLPEFKQPLTSRQKLKMIRGL